MEFHKRVIEIIDANLIYFLIPIILTLILAELIFKNRFETKKVLNLIRWTIIIYTIINWVITIIGINRYKEDITFINRIIGPSKVAYFVMLTFNLILPFSLLIKKLAQKFWYVLLIVICMKFGAYIEQFILIIASFHSDYHS